MRSPKENADVCLCVTYITNCIKYCCKLLCMGSQKHSKNCYKMMKLLDEDGWHSWASKVCSLLYQYVFGYVWIAQEIGNENAFIITFKLRLTDCMRQNWHSWNVPQVKNNQSDTTDIFLCLCILCISGRWPMFTV